MRHEIIILNPLQLLGMLRINEVIHRDGAEGVLVGPGYRPDYVCVRFADGVETNQPFTSLRLKRLHKHPKSVFQVLSLRLDIVQKPPALPLQNSPSNLLTPSEFSRVADNVKRAVMRMLESGAEKGETTVFRIYDGLVEILKAFNEGSLDDLDETLENIDEPISKPVESKLVRLRFLQELDRYQDYGEVPSLNVIDHFPILTKKQYQMTVQSDIVIFLKRRIALALSKHNLRRAREIFLSNACFLDAEWFDQLLRKAGDEARSHLFGEIEEALQKGGGFQVSEYLQKAESLGIEVNLDQFVVLEQELQSIIDAQKSSDWHALVAMRVKLSSPHAKAHLEKVIQEGEIHLKGLIAEKFNERNAVAVRKLLGQLSALTDTKPIWDRLQQVEPQWIRQKKIESLKAELAEFLSSYGGLRFRPSFSPRRLDALSAQLILEWADYARSRNEDYADVVHRQCSERNHKVSQMWSARNAEVASAEYWRRLGNRVEDVSIHQVTKASNLWIDYDLNIGGVFIDVKNARTSFRSEKNFSDLCVSRFKKEREVRKEILIQGVLSTYKPPEMMDEWDEHEVTILGVVSKKDIQVLEGTVSRLTNFTLSIQTLRRDGRPSRFLPGWIFEHPVDLYVGKARLIRRCRRFLDEWNSYDMDVGEIPLPILLFCDAYGSSLVDLEHFGVNSYAVDIICSLLREEGVKLRSVVMAVILACIRCKRLAMDDFQPIDLKQLFYLDPDADQLDTPLGLHDPFEYVSSFINVFETIYRKNRNALASYNQFKLQGANILKGSRGAQFPWETIVAYCGGRDPVFRVACGKNPIFLGESYHCSECHRLICPECGFCSDQCPERQTRQERERFEKNSEDDIPF